MEMKKELSSLVEENDELKRNAGKNEENGDDSAANLINKDLKCQIDVLKKMNEDLIAAKDSADSELCELRIKLSKSAADGDMLRCEMESRTKRMTEDLERCERDKQYLISGKDLCIGNLEATVSNHLITIGKKNEVINGMKLDIAKLKDELKDKNACGKLTELQNCLTSREYKLKEARNSLACLRQQMERTNYELGMLKTTNDEMQQKQNCYTTDLEATLEEKNIAIQLMLRKHDEMRGTIESLTEEKKELEEECCESEDSEEGVANNAKGDEDFHAYSGGMGNSRPKKLFNGRSRYTCSKCNVVGHNRRRKCPDLSGTDESEGTGTSDENPYGRMKTLSKTKRTCSECWGGGHDRRKCPKLGRKNERRHINYAFAEEVQHTEENNSSSESYGIEMDNSDILGKHERLIRKCSSRLSNRRNKRKCSKSGTNGPAAEVEYASKVDKRSRRTKDIFQNEASTSGVKAKRRIHKM